MSINSQLPKPISPVANYVAYVLAGNMLYISGQLPFEEGKVKYTGHLGDTVSNEDGVEAAKLCALHILAQAQAALGSLDKIKRCVKLTGFVSSTPAFTAQPSIINGASDLMVSFLGEAGKHARSAVGVAALPLNAAVEIEAIFEVK